MNFPLQRLNDKDEGPVNGRKDGKSANSKGQVGREVEGVAQEGRLSVRGGTTFR